MYLLSRVDTLVLRCTKAYLRFNLVRSNAFFLQFGPRLTQGVLCLGALLVGEYGGLHVPNIHAQGGGCNGGEKEKMEEKPGLDLWDPVDGPRPPPPCFVVWLG